MRALRILLLILPAACTETPKLQFVSDEASAPAVDATSPPRDATLDGALDAAADGGVDPDADITDASNLCENGVPPPGATICCGSVPCVDRTDSGCNCAACDPLACSGWCCINSNQKVSCKNKESACK